MEALGTKFMVRDEGPRFSVALLEGKVAVDIAAADTRRAILRPGDTLVQERDTITLAHDRATDMANWTSGRLSFDAVPLRRIVAEMNRYSTRKIEIADEALAARPFSGTFSTDGGGALVEALEAYGIARIVKADDGRIVIRAR